MIEYKNAPISQIIQRTQNIKSFRFKLDSPAAYKAGQCMTVEIESLGQKKPFSLSSSPHQTEYIEFSKKMTDSDFSKALDNLKTGDTLNLKYPFGNFILPENNQEKLCFLSGGIGVAAIIPMTTYLANTNPSADIFVFCGNRTQADIAFKSEFEDLKATLPNLKILHILSHETQNWQGKTGFVTAALVKEQMTDYHERKFFVCGPPAMVKAMQQVVTTDLGLLPESLVWENFTGY